MNWIAYKIIKWIFLLPAIINVPGSILFDCKNYNICVYACYKLILLSIHDWYNPDDVWWPIYWNNYSVHH